MKLKVQFFFFYVQELKSALRGKTSEVNKLKEATP